VFSSTESSFEQVRQTQRELLEQVAAAQRVARVRQQRRDTRRMPPGPFRRAARLVRTALVRP
jgi:hypothetical protein